MSILSAANTVRKPPAANHVEIGPIRPDETRAVAQLHSDFFGGSGAHGVSLAMLGVDFLEGAFYKANLDNPYFFVDVARYDTNIIGFSVYSSDHRRVFRYTARKHPFVLFRALLKCVVNRPVQTVANLANNRAFLTASLPEETRAIPGWFVLLGVREAYRTREFQRQTGVWIAGEFKNRLERVLRERGCKEYWAAPSAANAAANLFYRKIEATLFAQGFVQGVRVNYYRMSTGSASTL